MKSKKLALLAVLIFNISTVSATEYIYRDLMANTLPTPGCVTEQQSIASAIKPYNVKNYSKKFCQSQGYGWHVDVIKDEGKPVCNDCGTASSGNKQCHLEDVVVTCKRIKPGSVGMLPGKS